MSTAIGTQAALKTAITQDAVPSPADNASAGDPPAAGFETVTELSIDAARAVATAAPTYLAMFETPDAPPT
jgi:hypothetical protein